MRSTTTREPRAAVSPAFLAFLLDRLTEEIIAATYRRQTATGPSVEAAERGLRLLDELILGLKRGEAPDHMSLGMLTVAYGDHPDFRASWNRWTPAD
ncbi:hypothetical protein [Nocardioides sp.]|uniref:hypothetical protein n=1 Tax=Nocardioides sp. TaxID=35761 RepID=UPI003D0BE534